jgi:hypothetical protein
MALSCHHSMAGCRWKQSSADERGSGEYIESATPGDPTRASPLAWGFDEGRTIPRRKNNILGNNDTASFLDRLLVTTQ